MAKRPATKTSSKSASAPKTSARKSAPKTIDSPAPPETNSSGTQRVAAVTFSEILGQDRALDTLRASIRSKRIHHAWIFHGPNGVGKLTAALAFAAAILDPTTGTSLTGDIEPDPDSPVQSLLRAGTHPDLHVITKELARFSADRKTRDAKLITIPKDVIETHLITPAYLAPSVRNDAPIGKVFIVDEAELLDRSPTNAPTQNALLKTIEEPPERTAFILVTSAEDLLLPTIRSRCQRVAFRPLDADAMRTWLKTHADIAERLSPKDQQWAFAFADGSPGVLDLALKTGILGSSGSPGWVATLDPSLSALERGTFDPALGPVMAKLADEWAEAWVKSHDNASKEAANRAAADWMLRLLATRFRTLLRGSVRDPIIAERAAGAIELLRTAERRLDANLQGVFVFDALAADLAAHFAGALVSP
ncbi:MAG: AAA family ATPase [Phycisphaerales bacterium]|nr:MAG: AAA family ATPase [Phycisphaerales bacterium]